MDHKLFLAFAFSLITVCSCCQGQSISIGFRDTIYSKILKEKREIYIHTPANYDKNKVYPVAYVLDGETQFQTFTAIADHLGDANINAVIPDMIVVGMVNTDRCRDYTPTYVASATMQPNSGGGEQFTSFMAKELIPYIDSHYSTATYRLLAGHSLGGLFALNAILKHSLLFNSYIILDPSTEWDDHKLVKEAINILSKDEPIKKRFSLAVLLWISHQIRSWI